MFESDIIIQGGPFVDSTKFEGILSKRMNLVYGRNGCGKTSIARAFREQQTTGDEPLPDPKYSLSFDGSGSFSPDVQRKIFVFNEDFIDNSVKFSREGLKSIVRIGASAQLDVPIQAAKDRIAVLENQRTPLVDEHNALAGRGNGSFAEAEKALKDGLKSANGFIDRLSRIEGRRPNLTGSLLATIAGTSIKSPGTFNVATETAKLQAGIDRYLTLQDGTPVNWTAPSLSGVPDLDAVNALLEKSVRPAELSDQERTILDDLSTALASEDIISKTQKLIVAGDRAYCPLCHQPVTAEHKRVLEQRLLRFRDQQVEDFKDQIDAAVRGIRMLDETLPDIPVSSYQSALQNGEKAIDSLNARLSEIMEALEKKRSNPWSPQPVFPKNDFKRLVSDCQAAFSQLDTDVASYNQAMQEKRQLFDHLKQDNITLAIYENLPWILEYNKRWDRDTSLENEIDKINREIEAQRGIIADLQGKMDQIDDAREQINNYLDIVFGRRKLRLENAGKDKYKLQLRRGNIYVDIPPRAISSGERNALALAYFFACVMERKVRDYAYSDPTLLVIDDPVSSFDAENKAGVISLLSMQCKKVLKGRRESKVLIFTHDITTLRELCSQREGLFRNDDAQTKDFLRLSAGSKLEPISCTRILENMEYDSELKAIFDFANANESEIVDEYDNMGNTIRRFAESYANRMFRCKWGALFTYDVRVDCLPPDLQDKICSFAIRPILNSESHGVIDEFEPAEVQRAARILLIYILYASPDHLRAFLGSPRGNEWKVRQIESWAADI